jgi:hypothetical protein
VTARGRAGVLAGGPGLVAAAAAALAVSACTVGEGSGSAKGQIQDIGCNSDNTLATPQNYSLEPSFFAGEPIEDVCPPSTGECSGPRQNRLTIRMQHTGNPVEMTDTLYVDVLNSYEVARCLRGRVDGGVAQWNTRFVTGPDGQPIPGLRWCDWSAADVDAGAGAAAYADSVPDAGAPPPPGTPGTVQAPNDGGTIVMTASSPRINLSPQDWVQASFAPLFTCVQARSVGVALPGSWIDFQHFGAAEQGGAPSTRTAVNGDFQINFGDQLQASFHLVLGDQAVQYAIKTNALIPTPRIGGYLDGAFDFDLQRGRAAQPFP